MVLSQAWPKRVAARVRAQITASGLSKTKVLELADIPKTTFYRRYNGTDPWDTAQLDRIARALRISPNDLMPVDNADREVS